MFATGKPASPRILVVRLGAMGDVIHALPAVAALKQIHPGCHLTWLIEPRWLPLLEDNPFVDRVVTLRRDSLGGLLETWRDLRARSYEFAVDFQGLIKSALSARAARPGRIYGFHRSQVRERAAAWFYSHTTLSRSAHVVDRNLDLALACGSGYRPAQLPVPLPPARPAQPLFPLPPGRPGGELPPDRPTQLPFPLPLGRPEDELPRPAQLLFPLPPGRPEGELPPGDFFLASPLAGWQSKQWPLEYYVKLGERLKQETGIPLVLNGPPDSTLPHRSGLPGLIHATRRALAVVGVDSGPLHLAAALGKPGVAIFGPTDPARNGPYGGSLRVLRAPAATTTYQRGVRIDGSMRQITPAQVFDCLLAGTLAR